jgi:hypothetical protein
MYAVLFHAHQKLDRVAYKNLEKLLNEDSDFPDIKDIIHFDGVRGPDSLKLKRRTDIDQPWHFIDPTDLTSSSLNKDIKLHYEELVKSLKQNDKVRAAFQAAWLAHALVDGLTPAHHYPYEEELANIRGQERQNRKGILGRAFVKGETLNQSILKSLKLIGPKGLLTTHAMFEAGAYAIIAPLKLSSAMPNPEDVSKVIKCGVIPVFQDLAREVADFNLYSRFYIYGWTNSLSRDVRVQLAPRMARMITLAWYAASLEAST